MRATDHLEDLVVDGKIILNVILKKKETEWGPVTECCELGNEILGAIKLGEYRGQLSHKQLYKDSVSYV